MNGMGGMNGMMNGGYGGNGQMQYGGPPGGYNNMAMMSNSGYHHMNMNMHMGSMNSMGRMSGAGNNVIQPWLKSLVLLSEKDHPFEIENAHYVFIHYLM